MKKFFLFLASALMIGTFAISCGPEEKPADNQEPEPTPVEKSKAAKLLTFSLTNGTITVAGEIFDADKVVELQYNPEEADAITDGTAAYTISEKATIDPDPATIKDWSAEVKLTVTAEDGETKNEYTVKATPLEYDVKISPVAGVDGMLLTAAGANNDIAFYGGNELAFSGTSNIVTCDRRVYDLDFKFVGELNWGDILPTAAIMGLGNDDNGVLIAAVAYGDPEWTVAPVDGEGAVTWNYTSGTRFYAWPNGWDQAPVKFYENGSRLMYMNVSGDYNNNMLIVAKQGSNDGGTGNHHLFHFEKGAVSSAKWAWFETGIAEVPITGTQNYTPGAWRLGASAGSTCCPLGVDKADALFVYGQALTGLAQADPNYSDDKWGKDGNAGMIVAARQGYQGTDLILEGTAETVNGKTKPHRYGGLYGWGNHCMTGAVKAFKYSGNVYAAVAGSNWNETHLTVVDVTASTAGNTVALYPTTSLNTGAMAGGGLCSVAYIYDAATSTGHIAVMFATPGSDKSSTLRRLELTREKK